MTRREKFHMTALRLMSTPYIWGGKAAHHGLDCSGLVTWSILQSFGLDWRSSHNTDALWAKLEHTDTPRVGDLAFYGGQSARDVDHVMIVSAIDQDFTTVIGATGGDSSSRSFIDAMRRDACVKPEPLKYMKNFRGFRSLPKE
jgi:cell wall-associated NlpC family hydrolase